VVVVLCDFIVCYLIDGLLLVGFLLLVVGLTSMITIFMLFIKFKT
jgi:hypothetical protein